MNASDLPDDPVLLKQMLLQKIADCEGAASRIEHLEAIIAYLRRKMYGPRSEKINANQLLLFGQSVLPLTSAEPATEVPEAKLAAKRPGLHGRRIIPDDLPRETEVVDVPEEQKPCPDCGTEREKIGEEVTEQLEFIPARLFVRKIVRPKYACRKCQANVVLADKPHQVVEKGLAGPGLIAHIAVAKYADHLPLYRLEGIFARYGVQFSRSTMCDWMAEVADLATPLVRLMRQRILASWVIHTDDTTVPVQDRGKTRTGRLWVYMGDAKAPYNVFEYTPNRNGKYPQAWLEGFGGYLQADAYAGYDDVYGTGKVQEVACWAHVRRKFFEAKENDPKACAEALGLIRALYQVEEEARESSDEKRLALRQEKSVPLLGQIKQMLVRLQGELLPQCPVTKAVTYCQNQWEALERYTTAGFLSIDNNAAEREIRPVALGRKNWLFAGSDEGGRTAATIYSLIRSATRHGLNVEYYLRSILAHLPGTPQSELPHLLPDQWKKDLAEEEAKSPKPQLAQRKM